MTVGEAGKRDGVLRTVVAESGLNTDAPDVLLRERDGKIWSNLRLGADVASAVDLKANERLSSPGVKLHGSGFIVTPAEAASLGLGEIDGLDEFIRPYRNGRDLTARPRGVMVIDLFPLTAAEVRNQFPSVYQWVADRVNPERDQNREEFRRQYWWWFGRRHTELRRFIKGLHRFITTVEK